MVSRVLALLACTVALGCTSSHSAVPDAGPPRSCLDPRCTMGCCPLPDAGNRCCAITRCDPNDPTMCYCGSGPECPWPLYCCGDVGLHIPDIRARCTPYPAAFCDQLVILPDGGVALGM